MAFLPLKYVIWQKNMIKILLFSCDPGGANTIIPLYKVLLEKGYQVFLYGKDTALKKYEQVPLPKNEIHEDLDVFIKRISPNIVITGTSANDKTEKNIWKECEKQNIPSFAILDQWLNYGVRFSNYGLNDISKFYNDKTYAYLPTKIIVMDEFARKEAINDGLPEERLVVCGQPYFETLIGFKPKLTREELGFKKNDFIITFASEPISKSYGEDANILGYTEKSILKNVLDALSEIDYAYKFVIRPHPKENLEDFKNTNCIIENKVQSQELIYHSDLVIGMSSMFLIEAILMNKAVLSVQIGLKIQNPFILDKIGVLKSIIDIYELKKQLREIIVNKNLLKYNFEVIKNPVDRIINLMERTLCLP